MINLRHRGVLLNNVSCVMCGEQDETINHLLFTCKVATNIWNMCITNGRELGGKL